jgi:hypothetical protein
MKLRLGGGRVAQILFLPSFFYFLRRKRKTMKRYTVSWCCDAYCGVDITVRACIEVKEGLSRQEIVSAAKTSVRNFMDKIADVHIGDFSIQEGVPECMALKEEAR